MYRFLLELKKINTTGPKNLRPAMLVLVLFGATFNGLGQIAQRGTSTKATVSGTTTITINKPTGVVQGDVMIVNIAQEYSGGGLIDPTLTGWTKIDGKALLSGATNYRGTVLYRVAGASEGTNYTFSMSSGGSYTVGTIVAFSGVDVSGATPFDVTPGTITIGSNAAVSATSITTATANAAVIMFGMSSGSGKTWSGWTTATSPGALTELYDNQESGLSSVGAAWATMATPGTTGAGSATLSGAEYNGGILIALKCAVSCTTPDAPASATATATGTTSANLAWTATSGATGSATVSYYWVIGANNTVTYGVIGTGGVVDQGTTGLGTLSASTTALTCGTTYYLRVMEKTSCDNSSSTYTTSSAFTTSACCTNPTAYAVTGGGAYCTGLAGIAVGLANSQTGVNYQLLKGGSATGMPLAVAGTTGSAITFGLQTAAGTYTVQATTATGSCTQTMTGSVTVSVNSPNVTNTGATGVGPKVSTLNGTD